MSQTTIKIQTGTHEALRREKFRISGLIGTDFTMDDVVSVLLTLGGRHDTEVIRLAREVKSR